jgi:virginiamycin B lyase
MVSATVTITPTSPSLAGIITEFPVPTGLPAEITSGPDGNLWFTAENSTQIGRVTPGGDFTLFPIPTSSGDPFGITSGPDGNLWFTEAKPNQIGRITSGA